MGSIFSIVNCRGQCQRGNQEMSQELEICSTKFEKDQDDKQWFLYQGIKYYTSGILGKGQFSEVMQVQRQSDNKIFALKILSFSDCIEEFINECQNLRMFNSEYITKLEGSLIIKKQYALMIEYANKGTLEDFYKNLKSRNALKPLHIIDFISNIFQGLEVLHSKKVIHRDLKLDNLLVHDYKVKISDFGLSTQLKNKYANTQCGNLLTRPQDEKQNESTDIYRAGAIACQLLFNLEYSKVYSLREENKIDEIMNAPEKLRDFLLNITNSKQDTRYSAIQCYQIVQSFKFNNDDIIDYINQFINKDVNPKNSDSSNHSSNLSATTTTTVITSTKQQDNTEDLYQLGMNFMKEEKYDESRLIFKQIIQLQPGVEKYQHGLASLEGLEKIKIEKQKMKESEMNKKEEEIKGVSPFQSVIQKNPSNKSTSNHRSISKMPENQNSLVKSIESKLNKFNYNCFQFEDDAAMFQEPQEFQNGSIYMGQWKNEMKNGRGYQIWANGSVYEGYWKNNAQNGRGRLILPNGDRYEGEWRDDKFHGKGTYIYYDGVRYEGDWVEHQQQGKGIEYYTDGCKYEGQFEQNNKTKGIYYFQNGSKYSGCFLNSKWHGQGKLTLADGCSYEGEWRENIKEGQGTFKWPDGRKYEGQFKNGLQNGFGEMTFTNKTRYKGFWKNGKQHGQGMQIHSNGYQLKGNWHEGTLKNWIF